MIAYSAAALAGAAVMIYELLAIRILQRYFGGTMDVWASEIAVCLGGLALGYAIGGRLADRFRSQRIVGIFLFGAGAAGLLIHPLAEWAGDAFVSTELLIQWQPLMAAGVSTFVPIAALGTVMPLTIGALSRDADHAGRTAGRVAAVSTLGSIVGVLVTPMLLLRHFGIVETLNFTSGLLILAGALMQIQRRTVAVVLTAAFIPAFGQVQFETYSNYHHILVEDAGDVRALLFDNNQQSLMSLSDPSTGGFEYTDYFHLPLVLDPKITRVLFLGLGGGTGPKSFLRNYPAMRVEVVEIDPEVVKVAKQFFAIPDDPRLSIQVADARTYLQRGSARYGAILMDAYASGPRGMAYLPYHLATQEFFTIVWERLDNGGSFFFNAIGRHNGDNAEVLRNVLVTLESVFQAVYVFEARTSINTVFIAQKIDMGALDANGLREGKTWPEGPWMAHPLSGAQWQELIGGLGPGVMVGVPNLPQRVTQFSRAQTARRNGVVLTDDFAPTDVGGR
ncbi:MAG: fused MFS/spermidine synthase [Candidatus Hydrogenedentota bacterium]